MVTRRKEPTAFVDAMLAELKRGHQSLIISCNLSCLSWFETIAIFGWPGHAGPVEHAYAIASLEWLLT